MGSILLVQTDLDTSERWATEIRRAGHDVLLAITWRDAHRQIRRGGIDAVVIDSFDPRMGYEQLARSIRGLPDAPPILLVSSSPSAAALSTAIGGSVCLPKPCDLPALIKLVNQLVGSETASGDFKEIPTAELQFTS